MDENPKQVTGVPFLVAAASFVIIVAGMRAAEALMVPFLLSAFIAVISAPPLFWLQRKRVPTVLALLIVVAGVVAIILALAALVGASVEGFSRALPQYQARLQEQSITLLGWLQRLGITVSDQRVLEHFDPRAAMNLVATMLSSLGGVLTNAFLILLTVVFILLEASTFPTKLHAILGGSKASLDQFGKVTRNVQRYMAIKTLVSLITGIAIAIWLAVLGVDFPLLWGLLAFLLNYVPNIGSIIAAVPAVLLAFIQLGIGPASWAALGYLVVNVVMGQVFEPRLMGQKLGLSTLVVFISLVFWGWVLGPVGMFLSVPLTMTVKIALDSHEQTRWLAILLGSEASAKALVPTPPAASASEPAGTDSSPTPPGDTQ